MKITKKLPLKNVANFHPEIKDRTEEVLERKSLVSSFTGLEDNEAIGIISAPSVDQDGDIIDPMGIKTDIYNGTIQWNHCLDTLPIGTMTEWTITPEGVKGKFKFSNTYDFAIDVYNLIKEKILKGISIGYIPVSALRKGTTAFNEYAKTRGWDVTGCERIITEALWIETSMVPVGCNNDALILASKSFKSEISFKNFKIESSIEEEKGCKEDDKAITEDLPAVSDTEVLPEVLPTVPEEVVEEVVVQETEVIEPALAEPVVETPDILIVEASKVLPEVSEQQVVKPLVLKVIRVGKMLHDQEIKRKALLYLQGKSF